MDNHVLEALFFEKSNVSEGANDTTIDSAHVFFETHQPRGAVVEADGTHLSPGQAVTAAGATGVCGAAEGSYHRP